MPLIHHIPVWLIVLAICIPLTLVAWSSRQLARDIARTADYEPKTIDEGPMINNGNGTLTQTIRVSMLESVSGATIHRFGPIEITANAREWAANSVLLGVLLVLIGMLGLLHFPTASSTLQSDPPEVSTSTKGE